MKPDPLIRGLIWIYALLLLGEGALRKWVFPEYSDLLLVVRDPVALAIVALALLRGRLPLNSWVLSAGLLAVASFAGAFLASQSNLLITAYGLRTNYLHLPLIWIIATALTRRDVENLGKALLVAAIPMTILMVVQFLAPVDSFINRGVGLGEGRGQLYGALGHIRPPGLFAFITGPQLFYPLATAFLCHQLTAEHRLRWPLLAACGVAIVVALPVSISRTTMLATLFVAAVFMPCLFRTGRLHSGLLRTGALLGLVVAVAVLLPFFGEARDAFADRWTTAIGHEGDETGFRSILGRLFGGSDYLFNVASRAPLFGAGIGMGSNVAARLSTGRLGFILAESEWAKCILELGLPLAVAFLGYRFLLVLALLRRALHRLRHAGDPLPLLILSAAAFAVLFGQWAPPTILGFAILGSGLCLAACQDEPAPADESDQPDPTEPDNPSAP